MTDQELVENIIKYSGGKENIRNVTNCMTRLRFEIKNERFFDVEKIKLIEGVLSVVADRKNYPEIVLGPGRCRKCADICREQGLYSLNDKNMNADGDWKNNKNKIKSSEKNNSVKNILKTFGDVFVPLIPGVIVAGICAGIAMLISQCIPDYKNDKVISVIYQLLSLVNISFMTYINAWVGYRAAEKFGATPILGGMLGMITNLDGINEISKIFGLWDESMPLASILRTGKGGILAVLITVIILAKLEKWIRKHIPENLDTIFTPLISIIVCSFIHIIIIMPLMGFVSTIICDVVEMGCMSDNVFVRLIVGYLSALLFLPLVAMGMHHGLIAIYSVQLEKLGYVTLYPSLAMAGAGQVGAAIALYIIAKRINNKQLCKVIGGALPAGILGIGEPLIYGVTLPLGKPFITAGLGAGFGGAFIMMKQVASTTWGPSGILALFIMTAGPNKAIKSMIYYVIGLIISIVMGFIITYLLFSEKELVSQDSENESEDVNNIIKKSKVNFDEINNELNNRFENEKDSKNEINNLSCNTDNTKQKENFTDINANMKILRGKSATTGIAMAEVVLWDNYIEVKEKKITNIDEEIKRFDNAYNKVLMEMEKLKNNVDEKTAEIVEARKMILEDNNFITDIKNKIKNGYESSYAVSVIGKLKFEEFNNMENEYLRARSIDINDITKKLISVLCNVNNREVLNFSSIVVAEEITPEDISNATSSNIVGFATKKGTVTSHASIVASNLGIPYVFDIDYNINEIKDAKLAIIDSDNATFILNPDRNTYEEYSKRKNEEEKLKSNNKILSNNFDNELEKFNINVYANIAGPNDIDMVLENGANGIGLYRTEFLYMKKDVAPSEDEQFEAYKSVLTKMGNKEVIIRTMDIGADKEAKCLSLSHEENPALGKRAIRICLDNTDLFRTQLRALLRAAVYGNEKIMFPMIASVDEIKDIKVQIKISEDELKEKNVNYKVPPIGIMIETPAAAVLSSELAKEVDFFSIGTNDLTQYTLAVDRTGKELDRFYRPCDEAVLRLIKMTVDGAKTKNIPVGICGEIGGDINIIPKLLEIGVNEFSMAPSKIFKAKQKIVECLKEKTKCDKNNNYIEKFENNKQDNVNKKITNNDSLVSPIDGEIIPMDQIPDKAFSSGSLGRCIGIKPINGNVYAPIDGEVISIAETKHAIGIRSNNGGEILIHFGIDTVKLNGKGFELKVKEGDKVSKGDLLLIGDLNVIESEGFSPIVIVAITKE